MALAVIIVARKLKPYFDCHPIQVLTNQPLEKAVQRKDSSSRLLKWAVELSEYDIQYKPRTAIKAQVMADFVVETSYEEDEPWRPHRKTCPLLCGAIIGRYIK